MLLSKALILSSLSLAWSQINSQPDLRQQRILQDVSDNSSSFALDMLESLINIAASSGKNLMVSPLLIWSLLLPLVEGAGGMTLTQMRSVLRLSKESRLSLAYRSVKDFSRINTPSIKVAFLQRIFIDQNQPMNFDYRKRIEQEYDADILYPVDAEEPIKTAALINDEVRAVTKIPYVIAPQDLSFIDMVLLLTVVFKGQWKKPFNMSRTRSEPFYDEAGRQIGNVNMMVQVGRFNNTYMNDLEGHVLELPYGEDDRLSMLLILPNRGTSLLQVARNLQKVGIAKIFDRFIADAVKFADDEVEVFVPKFTSTSDLAINLLLIKMGMIDLFERNANLTKIKSDFFLNTMLQITEITVDEKGTTSAGVTVAELTNRMEPNDILLNRPFIYMVVEKRINLILFCGLFVNPEDV